MLGFSVSIRDEVGVSVGNWFDNGAVSDSLYKLVELNLAEVVSQRGGYPDIWQMKQNNLMQLLRFGISPMHPYGFHLDIKYDIPGKDKWVTVTLWDQS